MIAEIRWDSILEFRDVVSLLLGFLLGCATSLYFESRGRFIATCELACDILRKFPDKIYSATSSMEIQVATYRALDEAKFQFQIQSQIAAANGIDEIVREMIKIQVAASKDLESRRTMYHATKDFWTTDPFKAERAVIAYQFERSIPALAERCLDLKPNLAIFLLGRRYAAITRKLGIRISLLRDYIENGDPIRSHGARLDGEKQKNCG